MLLTILLPTRSLALPEYVSLSLNLHSPLQTDFSYSPTASSMQGEIEAVFSRLYPQYGMHQVATLMCVARSEEVLPFVMDSMFSQTSVRYKQPRVEITLTSDVYPNAYALPHPSEKNNGVEIVLTAGLMRLVSNESELAFILAHEMAHLRLEHFSPHVPFLILNSEQLARIALIHQNWELEADREALEVLETAGFNGLAAVSLLERLAAADESHTHTSSFFRHHPAIEERISEVRARLGLYETKQAQTPTNSNAQL